jgi:hypothetical protein
MSQYQTPLSVWQEIMEEREPGWIVAHGYALPEREESAAIRFGHAFESAVIELAERATGWRITHREKFFSCNGIGEHGRIVSMNEAEQENFITCHIDGNYAPMMSYLHEGKTTIARSFFRSAKDYENSTAFDMWGEPGTDKIPRPYQIQVQHQMLCTGAEQVIVSVLVFFETPEAWEKMGWETYQEHPVRGRWFLRHTNHYKNGQDQDYDIVDIERRSPELWASVLSEMGYFHQYPVSANAAAQEALAEKYRDFWENHVLTGKPPEPRNYDDVKRLFPEPKTTVIVPEYIERKLSEYKMIVEETAQAKKTKERIKTIATKYAALRGGTLDDESREAVIFRSASGKKLGTWTKKMFRVS